MDSGINNNFLYAAKKLEVDFRDSIGNGRTIAGTCFFVQKNRVYYLVTNRHNVEFDYKKDTSTEYSVHEIVIESKTIDNKATNPSIPLKLQKMKIRDFTVHYDEDYNNDFCVIDFNDVEILEGDENNIIMDSVLDYQVLADKDFFERLNVLDLVGFPSFCKYYDNDNNNPIFSGGFISSDPRLNYSYKDEEAEKYEVIGDCLIYQALSYSGASGSPVFSTQRGIQLGKGLSTSDKEWYRPFRCIGINAGHLREKMEAKSGITLSSDGTPEKRLKNEQYVHSGLSYFYKSYKIKDLIDKIEKENASATSSLKKIVNK